MIAITEDDLETAVAFSHQIPEFEDSYSLNDYQQRLGPAKHLILVAEWDQKPAGFKIGYDRFNDGSFYSWMGGVLPEYRKKGIAEKLAGYQENWAKENGFKSIKLKTRKKHQAMIAFLLDRGFSITKEDPNENPIETRIWMEKIL